MSNAVCELVHGNPGHDNIRDGAARNLLPGEIDFNGTTGKVMIADAGAKAGKQFAVANQDGASVWRIKNPAYEAGGSTAITQQIGAKLYIDRTTVGSAWNADTNPYITPVYANSASSLFLGTIADKPVRVSEEFIYFRFDNKGAVVPGAAAT